MLVGVDVGGTFTDLVGFRGREVVTTKVPSSAEPAEAVQAGLREVGATEMAHGTTVATNAILERKGARVAFVTTRGFEDLLAIGRQDRPNLYDFRVTRPPPAVDRTMCFGLRERVDGRGRVLTKPTAEEIDRLARTVRTSGAEAVAISLLFSFLRPDHEARLAEALRGLPVSVSHEVVPEFREYERSSTTVLDAYVKPLVQRYLNGLRSAVGRDFYMMKSGGGVAMQTAVLRRPAEIVLSGPAGGVAAAVSLARRARRHNVVTFDMGGTSADFSAIVEGRTAWTSEGSIDTFPLALPVVDIESVGAGGGSVAVRDPGGALQVGPESAGSTPGPMAYGRGGQRPTLTDADLVGGSLATSLLGGRLPLHPELAEEGLATLAQDLRLGLAETVLGVQRVVRATMSKAIRLVLARRGLDPEDFTLLAFGGAGPMHACALARDIGIPRVLVPFLPGAFSAYGILISDVRLEYGRSVVRLLSDAGPALRTTIEEFRERAEADLEEQGCDPTAAILEASADLRYRGQSYAINVPVRANLAIAFRRAHRLRYGYASPSEPIELVAVRLVARVPRPVSVPRPPRGRRPDAEARTVLFDDGWTESQVLRRDRLPVGFEGFGPLIIEEPHATTVVPPDVRMRVDRLGLLDIEVPS